MLYCCLPSENPGRCFRLRLFVICTGVTLFALVLHLNCTAPSQSESSIFFMYIIISDSLTQVITPFRKDENAHFLDTEVCCPFNGWLNNRSMVLRTIFKVFFKGC